ncbi:GTP pyrophosphokinase [Anaerotignum propionicum]|uniref:GTP pyrophosphokinase n=1 Tax=Anaerotignum propionicum TaxID=28446 RepID=UPI00210DDB60|nr:hypothetical protein [Anaerotignum propionicum]MCQ4936734.1 hypothetical protein [Anaerotignum propionicum]
MNGQSITRAAKWYETHKDNYSKYCNDITELVERLIKNAGINYSSISGRVKQKTSFLEKCKKDKYSDISQIMDVVGIRVVTYVQKDVERICNILEKEFSIDKSNSINKKSELKENEFGYLSVHYILSYNQTRKELPENNIYKDMSCEIQIRTLLQHSWAEISHDNNYKFSGVLPTEINRKFYMIAGALELIDSQFQNIADELEAYTQVIEEQIKNTNGKADIPIDSSSLHEYLSSKLDVNIIEATFNGADKLIIEELKRFGINTIRELDNIFPLNYNKKTKEYKRYRNFLGSLRDFMIISDCSKYFDKSWDNSWDGISEDVIKFLESYGVNTTIIKNKVYISHNISDDEDF